MRSVFYLMFLRKKYELKKEKNLKEENNLYLQDFKILFPVDKLSLAFVE